MVALLEDVKVKSKEREAFIIEKEELKWSETQR
jgi:hypothetical protein